MIASVMAGLVQAIPLRPARPVPKRDRRAKPGDDGKWTAAAAAVLLFFLTASPASAQLSCPVNAKSQSVVELMFGRKIGDRIGVTNAAWMRFVDREITPRFPEGLTVVDAAGQWRDTKTGGVVREPSKIVRIVMSDPEKQQPAIDAVIDAYKKKFRQQAVGVIVHPACISFQ